MTEAIPLTARLGVHIIKVIEDRWANRMRLDAMFKRTPMK
jgi:hypothetical protein